MKICPLCAEEVRDEAKVCRHCRHTFTPQEDERAAERRGRLLIVKLAAAGFVAWAVMSWLGDGGIEEIAGTLAGVEAWAEEGAERSRR